MTHKSYYIEVSQYHTPVKTNATLWDLEQALRAESFFTQANRVLNISKREANATELKEIRGYQVTSEEACHGMGFLLLPTSPVDSDSA